MPADCVKGKRWVVFVDVLNLAVRYKAKLDKSLEAVAYAEHQAVTAVKKLLYCLADFRVAECCGNKLA